MPPKTVLVLCTGNSCRSQMAEAILNHDLGDQVRALSAGTQPQPRVADGAIDAIRLIGLPTDDLFPKHVDTLLDEPIDLVVTVCDNAKETCRSSRARWRASTYLSTTRTANRWRASPRCATTSANASFRRCAKRWEYRRSSCPYSALSRPSRPHMSR